jgi:hypothetical protein
MAAVDKIDTALKPLLYLCKIFGLSPFSYTDDKQTGETNLVSLPSDVLWCVAVFICYLTNFALPSCVMNIRDPVKLYAVAVICKISSYLSYTLVVLLLSTFKRRNFLQILFLISEVDQVLYKDAERQMLYKKTRKFIVTEIVIISVMMVPLHVGYYCFYPKRSFLEYYALLIEILGNVSLILMVIQFTSIVLILRQRYKHLNKCFDFHPDIWRRGTKSILENNLLLADMKSCLFSIHTTSYGRHQIFEQRQIYSKLHDAVQIVNSYFGLPVLMFTFWTFMSVVYISYFCVWMIATAMKEGQQLAENPWTVGGLIWCVLCVLILLLIVLACQTTTEECNKAQILVEKLMLRSGLGYETAKELRVLSKQLNIMKVSFTAGGFFTLDLSFVHSFVAVICTYLVILAQFQ